MGTSVRAGASSGSLGGGVLLALGLATAFAACGNTRRSPIEEPTPEGGVGSVAEGGSNTGGSRGGSGGAVPQAGTAGESVGEEVPSSAGAGGAPDASCIEGAACRCGKAWGTVECAGGESSDEARCSCPPEDECRAPRGDCFEPCGGDATGLWVLEETCFPGVAAGARCPGGTLSGTSELNDFQIEVLENEDVRFYGTEDVDVRAQLPLDCLGIESVNRCADATFYVSPLFLWVAQPLQCAATACGFCECAGNVRGGGGRGRPWAPGAGTLPFGDIDVPYCVDGETMWAGGGTAGGEAKASYKFRRRSCVGTPLPCAERSAEQCGKTDDCQPGRCLAADADDDDGSCEGLSEEGCGGSEGGCEWAAGGCWGTPSERCDVAYCNETPGCGWGEPNPRCGGEPASCYQLDPNKCDWPGCSVRTCDVPDGWSGIDDAPCERLTKSACAKAAGCTLTGSTCTGRTTCSSQTDAGVCSMLECLPYNTPTCGGFTTRPCSDLSVDDCGSQPGCRLEW